MSSGLFASATAQRPGPKLTDPLPGTVLNCRTTLAHQTDVAVTVYNSDLALVRDTPAFSMLAGWVPLDNRCAPQYINAQLKLDAGEVHLAQLPGVPLERARVTVMAAPTDPMREEAFA
jgi:hypothetical protein